MHDVVAPRAASDTTRAAAAAQLALQVAFLYAFLLAENPACEPAHLARACAALMHHWVGVDQRLRHGVCCRRSLGRHGLCATRCH